MSGCNLIPYEREGGQRLTQLLMCVLSLMTLRVCQWSKFFERKLMLKALDLVGRRQSLCPEGDVSVSDELHGYLVWLVITPTTAEIKNIAYRFLLYSPPTANLSKDFVRLPLRKTIRVHFMHHNEGGF